MVAKPPRARLTGLKVCDDADEWFGAVDGDVVMKISLKACCHTQRSDNYPSEEHWGPYNSGNYTDTPTIISSYADMAHSFSLPIHDQS